MNDSTGQANRIALLVYRAADAIIDAITRAVSTFQEWLATCPDVLRSVVHVLGIILGLVNFQPRT